jgi:hypothetical protein
MRQSFLRLEHLEDRLTPATRLPVPVIVPPQANHGNTQIVVTHPPAPGGGLNMSPMIGLPIGSSGSDGSPPTDGSGGLGTSTGDPVGPGPGN